MSTINKAFKYRIYPSIEQQILLSQIFGSCRFVFNHYLNKRIELYSLDKSSLNYNACAKDMTLLKQEKDWLKDVDATALQSSLKNLDAAYQNFFRRIKKGEKPGFPHFKSRRNNQSYTSKNNNGSIKFEMGKIKIPKVSWLKAKTHRPVEGRILSATISKTCSGKYFVSILCVCEKPEAISRSGSVIGLDLGIKSYLTNSNGETVENPKYLRASEKQLSRLQRSLSRKTKDSNNREKARVKVAKCHEKITNQRNDFLHKLSWQLVRDYDIICIENLNIKGMVKNHCLAKSISDASWSKLIEFLSYKCNWYERELVRIGRFYASSQTCNECGFKNADIKDLSIREWICPKCGKLHDRDKNAANNILMEGLRILSTAGTAV